MCVGGKPRAEHVSKLHVCKVMPDGGQVPEEAG